MLLSRYPGNRERMAEVSDHSVAWLISLLLYRVLPRMNRGCHAILNAEQGGAVCNQAV